MRTPLRAAVFLTLSSLGTVGCRDQPTVPALADGDGEIVAPGRPLTLALPVFDGAPSSSAPLAGPPPDVPEEYDIEQSLIHSARSYPFVVGSEAGNQAITVFTGNRIRVASSTTVSFMGQPLTQDFTQVTEEAYVLPKNQYSHTGYAVVRIDGNCGYRADGWADHVVEIGWGMFKWGPSRARSTGEPDSQPACGQRLLPVDETVGGGSGAPPMTVTCWYRITYDVETREVLRTEFLYCTG